MRRLSKVHQRPMPQCFRERISKGVANVDESQSRRTWEEFEYRSEVSEQLIEHILNIFTKTMRVSTLFSSYYMFVSLTV